MTRDAGSVVDGFRLEQVVHRGGMATIWRVSRPDLAVPLAMKIPLLRYGEDPVAIIAFEVERTILPRLSGIHAPRFVAAGDFEQPYIAMEFVDGYSLRTRLHDTPLPYDEVTRLGAAIATALDAIHRQRVIHLDVKPSNVIMRPSGEATVVDFGLARHEELPDLLAEELHGPIGTGAYVSPEQVLRDRGDRRSDLFALGVILYFLGTGERPFGDPERAADWRRRLWRDPVPPRRRRPDFPPWLQEIVLRCLEVDPNARYATAAELAFALGHPDRVPLTARADRLEQDGMLAVARRRLRAPKMTGAAVTARGTRTLVVMAAIDLAPEMEPLGEALRTAVRRMLEAEPGARLACVNVLKLSRIAEDEFEDAQGRNLHLLRLAALKRWAGPLRVAADRITYHVLESPDPAAALIEHARENAVDQIVMGARASSTLRRYLGSVSSRVVAEAPCTVTVVRIPGDPSMSPERVPPP